MEEVWKDITGYEGLYKVSSNGLIKRYTRVSNGRTIYGGEHKQQFNSKTGYFFVKLNKDNKSTTITVHRIVAEAFLDNTENKRDVNHISGIKTDNRVENLEWTTHSENVIHSVKIGTHRKHGKRIKCIENGKEYDSCRKAAKELNIHHSMVYKWLYWKDGRPIKKGYKYERLNFEYI